MEACRHAHVQLHTRQDNQRGSAEQHSEDQTRSTGRVCPATPLLTHMPSNSKQQEIWSHIHASIYLWEQGITCR